MVRTELSSLSTIYFTHTFTKTNSWRAHPGHIQTYPTHKPVQGENTGRRQESLNLALASATIDTRWRELSFSAFAKDFHIWCLWIKGYRLRYLRNEQNIVHWWKCFSYSNKNLSKPLGGNWHCRQTLPSFISLFNSNCCSSSFPNRTRVDMLTWIWQIIETFHVIKAYDGPGTVSGGWVRNWEWDSMGNICWWLNYTTSFVTGDGLELFKDFYYLPPPTRCSVSQLIISFEDSWWFKVMLLLFTFT